MQTWVLIETLWNVKSKKFKDEIGANVVLIETLWNVKRQNGATSNVAAPVLIETLWNVKEDRAVVVEYDDEF